MDPLRTPAELMSKVAARIEGGQLAMVNFKEQHFLFSPVPVTHFGYLPSTEEQLRNAWLWLKDRPGRYLMVPDNVKTECFNLEQGEMIGVAHRVRWLLLSSSAAASGCAAPEKIRRYQSFVHQL
jgi:hypothetical protein